MTDGYSAPMGLRVAAALLGTVLLFSPWAFQAEAAGAAAISAWIAGFLLLCVGMGAAANPKPWPEWVNLTVGLWSIAAPRALDFHASGVGWSHVAVGSLVAALALLGLRRKLVRRSFKALWWPEAS
jgi:hypothetical protein